MKILTSFIFVQLFCSFCFASIFSWQVSTPDEHVADSDVLEAQRESLSTSNNLVSISWTAPQVIPLAQDNSEAPSVFLVTQQGSSVTGSSFNISALVRYENGQVASHIPVVLEEVLKYIPEDMKKTIRPPQT